MTDYVIAIYCFIDDFLKATGHKNHPLRQMTDAEIMTTALVASRYFSGNHQKTLKYMQEHHQVDIIDKSGFNRYLHALSDQLNALFIGLGNSLKSLNIESQYLIDSFPVSVCRNIRIPRNKLLKEEVYRGKNVSKREYFYGFKVQVITTAEGIPVEYFISAGAFADITAFQSMNIDLPPGSTMFGDSGYTDYGLEDFYRQCEDINLLIYRKKNSKRADSAAMAFIKKQMRKRIETTFSEIVAFFPQKIHAVTPQGFLLKVFLFLFAYTLEKTIR